MPYVQDLSTEELSEMKEKFFLLRRVRTDLEKVRMLVQLTYKRERVKRDKVRSLRVRSPHVISRTGITFTHHRTFLPNLYLARPHSLYYYSCMVIG